MNYGRRDLSVRYFLFQHDVCFSMLLLRAAAAAEVVFVLCMLPRLFAAFCYCNLLSVNISENTVVNTVLCTDHVKE